MPYSLKHRKLPHTINLLIISTLLITLVMYLLLAQPQYFRIMEDVEEPNIYSPFKTGWHSIELGAFNISTPSDFKYVKFKGIDSFVGLITNGEDSIHFDYGWYSNSFSSGGYIKSYDTINGVPASVAFKDNQVAGVHFPKARGENGFSIFCMGLENQLAIEIISTIKFTGRGGKTTTPGSNISTSLNIGQQVFEKNCLVCHSLDQKIIGPALRGIVTRKSKKWFTSWVHHPQKLIDTNEEAAKLYREYMELQHPSFAFTDEQMKALIDFVEH